MRLVVQEYMHYGNNLDALEKDIDFCNKDLCHIRVLHKDSILARDQGLKELKNKEDEVFLERKRREKELIYMKRAAQNKEMIQEKAEKRLVSQLFAMPLLVLVATDNCMGH